MWLLDSQANWPKYSSLPEVLPEKRKISVCFLTPADNSLIDTFSSYPRALAVTAYVLRFINAIRKKGLKVQHSSLTLSLTELKESKVMLIKLTQRVYYPQEYSQLSDAKLISKKSSILTLNPFLDSNGTMRVNGRLANSCLTYDERYPFIIPNSSNFCRMFLDFTHKTLLHADISLMMNAIQSQFYIPGLKRTVKKCVHHCLVCVRYKQKLKSQIMAALPPERCSFSLPFTYAGVDFAGPFQIKSGNLRNSPYMKGYACIFVCFSTKAIHLEACSSLSSDAFLAAFARFTGRRGLPKRLMSENGTNFLGASRSLRKESLLFLRKSAEDISKKYAVHGFKWKFIPPSAPHMGGLV
ncbi:uncharacterized protein LOC119616055 [Lucilia sericata]|uniref:uncharacterized protein LOC119616055 n=1 Tax=Lucilia sericata TaxID=13632 RepID=UPI0018A8783E|nr:uncharacterized protein LOC119616055 [Lucilia sericata]